jgi:ATP-dependent protease ClpP protease subunit
MHFFLILSHKIARIIPHKIKKDADRDFFMSAEEAKKYGIVDKVV